MKVLRTPEARFANLPEYPFAPNFLQITPELRLHYLDEGPRDAIPVLMLHGEPTWSYLYRHMIRRIAGAGLRALAPDLIGFGKSDKPAERTDHTYARQVAWIRRWVEAMELRNIILVCQDWGSLIGLRVAAETPERFAGILLANGGLPTDKTKVGPAFHVWRAFSRYSPVFPTGWIVQGGTKRKLSAAERAAYAAPFPNAAYMAAPREYPSLVPLANYSPEGSADNHRAWRVFEQWTKPFICCFSDGDPITRGLDREFCERVPGARGQPHAALHGGHFLQEDDPERFANLVIEVARRTPDSNSNETQQSTKTVVQAAGALGGE